MVRKKPVDPLEHERRARAMYDADRRAYRFGLLVGAPFAAIILIVVRESKFLPLEWPLIIGAPAVVALFCSIGYGCAELSWWMHRRHVAQRDAPGFEVLRSKPPEDQE